MKSSLAGAVALAVALVVMGPGQGAYAHHSMSMFDQQREVTVVGMVRQFQWTNPHCYIQLVAKDASGKEVEWSMEMGAPMYLYARGWRPSTLKPGTEVKVTAYPLRNGHPGGVVLDVSTPDGKSLGAVS